MSREEGDAELKDLVRKSLERAGVISRIKAELRASVFLALEDDDNWKMKRPSNQQLLEATSQPHVMEALSLLREFMEFFKLDYTLSVFDEEVKPETCLSRAELIKELNLPAVEDNLPVISHLLKHSMKSSSPSIVNSAAKQTVCPENDSIEKSKTTSLNSKKDVSRASQRNQKFVETRVKGILADSTNPLCDPSFNSRSPPARDSDSKTLYNKKQLDSANKTELSVNKNNTTVEPSISTRKDLKSFFSFFKSGDYESEMRENGKDISDSNRVSSPFKNNTSEKEPETMPFSSAMEKNLEKSLTSLRDLPSLNPLSLSSSSWSFAQTKSEQSSDRQRSLDKHLFENKCRGDSSGRLKMKSLIQEVMQSVQNQDVDSKTDPNHGASYKETGSDLKLDKFMNQDIDNISTGDISIKSRLDSIVGPFSDDNSGSELSVRSRIESFLPDLSFDGHDLNDSQDNSEEEDIRDDLFSGLSIVEDIMSDGAVSHISGMGCESLKFKDLPSQIGF